MRPGGLHAPAALACRLALSVQRRSHECQRGPLVDAPSGCALARSPLGTALADKRAPAAGGVYSGRAGALRVLWIQRVLRQPVARVHYTPAGAVRKWNAAPSGSKTRLAR